MGDRVIFFIVDIYECMNAFLNRWIIMESHQNQQDSYLSPTHSLTHCVITRTQPAGRASIELSCQPQPPAGIP